MSPERLSVHIRIKRLASGNESLYLDVYCDGSRTYEFLKLYLVPETTKRAKSQNKETMRTAESIRVKRLAELQEMRTIRKSHKKTSIVAFVDRCVSAHEKGTASTYRNVAVAVKSFFGEEFMVDDITENDVKAFFSFIETYKNRNSKDNVISKTTQHLYCSTFKTFLRRASENGLVRRDVFENVKIPRKSDSERQYLTIDEIRLLAATKLRKTYRRAFLFSCLTGMRRSDIIRLTWANVSEINGMTRITFRQKKTGCVEYLDIAQQAREMMGDRGSLDSRVFPKFRCDSKTNKAIQRWVESVGITKKITFHCARHTFAVMMLTIGVDIYTTSKLLGHKELSTTQIYAKIVDKKKQDAVSRIPIII